MAVPVSKIRISELSADSGPTLAGIVLPQSRNGQTWKVSGDQLADLVNAKYATHQTAKSKGAIGNGSATENAAFAALYADAAEVFVDSGTYKLSSQINLTAKDAHIVVHPDVVFTNAAWNMGELVTAIGTPPTLAYNAFYKDVTSAYDLWSHVVGSSIVTKASTNGAVVVSLFANCEVVAADSHGFGANFGVYVTGPGTGIVCEIDSHVTHADGLGYALVIDSVGSYASQAAIVIQPNNANAPFLAGISFNNGSFNAVTNNAIQFGTGGTAGKFLFSHADMMFTQAVMDTNVLIVGPSVASYNGLIRIDASAGAAPKISAVGSAADVGMLHQTKGTGSYQFLGGDGVNRLFITGTTGASYIKITNGSAGATISVAGTDTNSDVVVGGKGSGGVNLLDGAAASKLRVNTTGLGVFGTTPVAKQTVTGSRGANAALASLLTALSTYGLLTDSSTA